MLGNRILAATSVALLSVMGISAAPKDTTANPKELISHALQQEYLWTAGTPPLALHGELHIWDANGAMAKGEYTYNWLSPSQWREDIRFVNYQRVRIGDASGYWQKSSLDYEPQPIFKLESVLKLEDAVRVDPKQSLSKVRTVKENGTEQQCTEVKWPGATDRVMCFDPSNGALVSVEFIRIQNQHEPEITKLEYANFAPVAGKLVPREIQALHETKMVASIKILAIVETPHPDPALFNTPEGAVHWPSCKDAENRELTNSSPPVYPEAAKLELQQGRVIYYGVVESDGTLSHLTLIQGAVPLLDAATLQTLKGWRYKPAVCGQEPARTETSIAMDFFLSGR